MWVRILYTKIQPFGNCTKGAFAHTFFGASRNEANPPMNRQRSPLRHSLWLLVLLSCQALANWQDSLPGAQIIGIAP
jgi:hypothetical protein